MSKTLFVGFLCVCSLFSTLEAGLKSDSGIVLATTRIELKEFPVIWNPSIVNTKEGILMVFRYCLAPTYPWISYIGIVLLDESLKPVSRPQLLNTRKDGDPTPSQAEDARIFAVNGKIYVIYNDNIENENPGATHRRDLFIAKVNGKSGKYSLSKPVKLKHPQRFNEVRVEKNWTPFDWQGNLLLSYGLKPHEILYGDLRTGTCPPLYQTPFSAKWFWGPWRGGTPALLVDGEYLAFFHSLNITSSDASKGVPMYHYYMGACTFSNEPPFAMKAASVAPIVAEGFYTYSHYDKRVIYPGGFVMIGDKIYLAYGKDDSESWIAVIDKEKLKRSLHPVRGL